MLKHTIVLVACLIALSIFSAGCGDSNGSSFIKYIGSNPSFGDANASTILPPLLLAAINDYRNSFSVDALQSDGLADNAMLDYVTVTWNPTDNEAYLNPYLIMEHAVNPPFNIVPAEDPGTDEPLMDALGAMYIKEPVDVVDKWKNGGRLVLISDKYTHVGIGCADPRARWAAFFFCK